MSAAMDVDARAPLGAMERLALRLGRVANEGHLAKEMQYHFLRRLSYSWMRPSMSRRTYVENIDWLIPAPSDRGVLFACNHRSFFDSYLYLFALYFRNAKWPRHLYFPIRSNFFYDSPLGVAVNFGVGAGVMYPPIFRDSDRKSFNDDALERMVKFLDAPCSVVGIHPEGKRNTGDPYELLPAQPGIGKVILHAQPLVVPVFVNGLSNDFLGAIRKSFEPDVKQTQPIVIVFGQPMDYSEFLGSTPRASLYKRCADKVLDSIRECGEREREIRAQIRSGEIATEGANWLR